MQKKRIVANLHYGFSTIKNGVKSHFKISAKDMEKAIDLAFFISDTHNVTLQLHLGILTVSIFSQDWKLLMAEMLETEKN